MPARFWAFAEACDAAKTPRAIRDLLVAAFHRLGFDSYALLTHAPRGDLRSLEVMAHSWKPEAIEHLMPRCIDEAVNPLFEAVERSREPVHWSSPHLQQRMNADQRAWFQRLHDLVRGNGVSLVMRCALVGASCSLTSTAVMKPERVMLAMRMANYAFHHIQFVQRPALNAADRLTAREHECLYRAAVCGERPNVVARKLGVQTTTVQTLRKRANARLDADNAEQAVWRMLETSQLFTRGRKSKPRTW